MRYCIAGVITLLIGAVFSDVQAAEEYYLRGNTTIDKPLYMESNDTFYELVSVKLRFPGQYGLGALEWKEAARLAFGMTHKGRQGRLAIVKSDEVHVFLQKFNPKREAWIGLRYWCRYGKLIWVDGTRHKLSDYQRWGSPWNISATDQLGLKGTSFSTLKCGPNSGPWNVHYWAVERGFRWNANGTLKHQRLFFVEYPPESGEQNDREAPDNGSTDSGVTESENADKKSK